MISSNYYHLYRYQPLPRSVRLNGEYGSGEESFPDHLGEDLEDWFEPLPSSFENRSHHAGPAITLLTRTSKLPKTLGGGSRTVSCALDYAIK